MTESPYPVGYGRPPEHTRFQKGQSGNPTGKPGPKKRLKYQFDAALSDALNGDRWELRDARPTKVIEALARKVTLDALDGRASAQRLLLAILDGEDPSGVEEGRDSAAEERSGEVDESEDEAEEESGEQDRFVFEDEGARQLFGDRYDEFKERFERAVNANNLDELADLAGDFGDAQFPAAGKLEKNGSPDCEPQGAE
jgi:hypothetical protein